MKKTKRMFKSMVALTMAICTVIALALPALAATTGFDILNSSKYAKTYTLSSTGKTIPYTSNTLATRGTVTYGKSSSSYIANSTDELYLMDVGQTNGKWWAYVSYPSGSRRVNAYIPLSAITKNNGSHAKTVSSGKFYCSIREGSANSSKYYVAKGDTVYLIATSGSKYQILYPVSGGWRLAWCNKSDYDKYCGGSVNNNTALNVITNNVVPTNNNTGLVDVTSYFAGKTVTMRSVENGQYLCAEYSYNNVDIKANRSSPTTWTSFTFSDMTSDGWIAIKAHTNGKYLTAVNNETDTPLRAYASVIQGWECFRIYMKGNDFYIKAQVNNKYLCVRVDRSGAPVQSYASAPSTWERIDIRFTDGNFLSAAEIISTAISNGIGANSNAYKALCSINSKYASSLSSSQKNGTTVFMFEGVGSNSSSSKRMNAMCVVVKNSHIVYLNRNSSTIPDYPFNPKKNDGRDMPTLKSGVYSFTTVNHRNSYAALNVSNAKVVRFSSKNSYYNSTSTGINVHRRDSDSIASSTANWVNSAGCLLIGTSGKTASSEYAKFIQTLGIVGSNARGDSKYSSYIKGTIVVDRDFAYNYLINVGYSASAIKAIG